MNCSDVVPEFTATVASETPVSSLLLAKNSTLTSVIVSYALIYCPKCEFTARERTHDSVLAAWVSSNDLGISSA